jgi:hypothetical protein
MADSRFAVHLGGGLYIDSEGVLHQGAPVGTPVYEAPFTLPVDAEKVKKALEGAKKFLADATDQTNIDKFTTLGVPAEVFLLLSAVGKIVGVVAPAAAVISFVIDFLALIGVLKSGPSALELLVTRRFDDLERKVQSLARLIQQHDLRNSRNDIQGFLSSVESYVNQLQNTSPSLAQLESDRMRLFLLHDEKEDAVANLLDQATWLIPFDSTEHTRYVVWPLVQWVLFKLPADGAPPAPAFFPGEGSLVFDHRLMVPLACYAAEAYLACIRGISPEYRTTGDFRGNLRNFALKLDALARNMRDQALARTIYHPVHFSARELLATEVEDNIFGSEDEIRIRPTCSRWPVGAIDLRHHNSEFFSPFLLALSASEFNGVPHPTKHGSMDFRWIPPARLRRVMRGHPHNDIVYQIVNPDECAAAANEQSAQDYADLLPSSGYINLLQLAGLLRNEATEPSKSQTVSGEASVGRLPNAAIPVTVESGSIFLAGVIKSPANRQPQDCFAKVEFTTQPIKRARPIEYVVKLRTLNSIIGKQWFEPAYEQYQSVRYAKDSAHPSFLRLDVTRFGGMAIAEHTLTAGSSPREPRHVEGVAEIKAHTFDWWIPVRPPFALDVSPEVTLAELRAVGWNGPNNGRNTSSKGITKILSFGGTKLAQNGEQDWEGERREVTEATIRINFSVDWIADRLFVYLSNRPSDRNYVVYVVVEEKMAATGQILHTAVAVQMNGQLTYVPQKFFKDERTARDNAAHILGMFIDKYSESNDVGPLDPIISAIRPGDLASSVGLERLAMLAEQHQPELLREVIAHEGHRPAPDAGDYDPPGGPGEKSRSASRY